MDGAHTDPPTQFGDVDFDNGKVVGAIEKAAVQTRVCKGCGSVDTDAWIGDVAHPRCPGCAELRPAGKSGCRDCGRPIEGCPRCDGWLQNKSGKYGYFFGCSNWPKCNYTKNAPS